MNSKPAPYFGVVGGPLGLTSSDHRQATRIHSTHSRIRRISSSARFEVNVDPLSNTSVICLPVRRARSIT